ncbi:MAG: sigma-70 family RNA polymerase sigma factor [Candidatus Hydrogenedentes bacterium]|nr:sigma-70 family RNA polymerase sigma factor [Candidatus Hydrogenedentota bacterium]
MKPDEFSLVAVETLSPLFNYAFRLTRSREEAEDLVQDTFERAFSNRERFDEPAAVRPVMFRILHNLFVNQWWAKKRRPALVSFEDWKDGDALPALCAEEGSGPSLLRDSLSEEVESALSELNEVQRATIWLREIEGFSYAEIAEVTGAPVGTVRSRLARARRGLAEQLLKYARARGLAPRDVVDRERNND